MASMFNLSLKKAKEGFFDREAVKDAVGEATARVMSRFGFVVMRRARQSIRSSKNISKPGKPPRSHQGSLRDKIFYSYEPSTRSVVVGPLPSDHFTGVPGLLERGGVVRADNQVIWVPGDAVDEFSGKRVKVKDRGMKRIVYTGPMEYRARPYMGPALEAKVPELPKLWKNSIRPR